MPANKEITLIVGHAIIKLKSGNLLNVTTYRSDRLGIYLLSKNTANIFGVSEGVTNEEEKLCYIPYDLIEVVLYDVAKGDTTDDSVESVKTPDEPQG